MEHRLAFTATTIKELQEKLSGYVEGKAERGEIEECYRGEVKKNKETLGALTGDAEFAETIDKWIQRGKYGKLLELWVKGLLFDWAKLYDEDSAYGDCKPRRLSLSTYPFAKERYWVELSQSGTTQNGVSRALHPLLQQNTSDLNEQRFSSTLSGEEFFLSDHVVNGQRVLPGVAYLEMVRAALERSVGVSDARAAVTMQNVVWMRPVVVSEAQAVHIGLYAQESGEIEFEIYSAAQEGTGEEGEVVYAQGRAVVVAGGFGKAESGHRIDIAALRSQCDQWIAVARCYEAYSAVGLEYGPAYRGLVSVQVGRDTEGQRFILAQVALPACVSETQDQYVLHPSVLDSALQASIGFSLESLSEMSEGVVKPALPFALERLEILDRSPAVAMVMVRASVGGTATTLASGSIQKLDIDICDEAGRVCVRLQGFTSRVVTGELGQVPGEVQAKGTFLLAPSWCAKPLLAGAVELPMEYGERWVMLAPIYKEQIGELQARCPGVKWAVLRGAASSDGFAAEALMAAGEQVFVRVQSILQAKPKQAVLLQVVVSAEEESRQGLMALSG